MPDLTAPPPAIEMVAHMTQDPDHDISDMLPGGSDDFDIPASAVTAYIRPSQLQETQTALDFARNFSGST